MAPPLGMLAQQTKERFWEATHTPDLGIFQHPRAHPFQLQTDHRLDSVWGDTLGEPRYEVAKLVGLESICDSLMTPRTALWCYIGRMKFKTSITLSKDLLREIDARVNPQQRSRSEFIEEAVRAFLAQADRVALQAREAALL